LRAAGRISVPCVEYETSKTTPTSISPEQALATNRMLDRIATSHFAWDPGRYGNVLDNKIQRLRATGMLEVRNGEIAGYKGKTLELKSGDVLEADLVVFGTGFRQDYSIFPHDLREKLEIEQDGLYLYRYILPSKIDNLAFVGKVAAVSNISSYGLQAEWLARKIVTQTLPSQEERAAEIAVRKQWARSWMPETAGRGSLVLLHQTHYHDQLLRDIGERPLRKGNLLSEYLMPYVSQDYNGILGMPLK